MFKKILSYSFAEFVSKGLNKLGLVVLPFLLSSQDYGKVGLILSFELLIPFITLLGFERTILRFSRKNKKDENFLFSILMVSVFFHLAIFSIIWLILSIYGNFQVFGLDLFPDIFCLLILVTIQGFGKYFFNVLRAKEHHNQYLIFRLFYQFLKFILIIVFAVILKDYFSYFIGSIISASVVLAFLIHEIRKYFTGIFNFKLYKVSLLFSIPFIIHGISNNLLGNADKIIMAKFLPIEAVGVYTLAYSIGSTILFVFIGLAVYIEPLYYRSKGDEKVLNYLVLYGNILSILGFYFITISLLNIQFLKKNELYENAMIFIPIIIASYFVYPYYLKSNYQLVYEKKSINLAAISVFVVGTNIILNIIFIPIYGVKSAAYINFFSYFFQAFIFILVRNRFSLTRENYEIIGIFFFIVIIFYLEGSLYMYPLPLIILISKKLVIQKIIKIES